MSTNRHIPNPLREVAAQHLRRNFSATCHAAEKEPLQVVRHNQAINRPGCIIGHQQWADAIHEHPLLAPPPTLLSEPLSVLYARAAQTDRLLLPIAREGWHVPVTTRDWAVVFVPNSWIDQLRDLTD